MIVIDGLPWPCSLPSPNGEVTRVIMITSNAGQWDIVSRLELPGLGHVELCKNDKSDFKHHLFLIIADYLQRGFCYISFPFHSLPILSDSPNPQRLHLRDLPHLPLEPYPLLSPLSHFVLLLPPLSDQILNPHFAGTDLWPH